MHQRSWWKDGVRENGLISQMKRRTARQARVCVCVFQKEGCVWMRVMFGFPLGLQAERVREVPQEQQERSWLYFDNNNKVVLPHSLSLFLFIYPALAQCVLPLSFDPWKKLVMFFFPPHPFFWRVWCTKEQESGKKKTLEIGALCPNWTSVR